MLLPDSLRFAVLRGTPMLDASEFFKKLKRYEKFGFVYSLQKELNYGRHFRYDGADPK
jgi:hypothetical protein